MTQGIMTKVAISIENLRPIRSPMLPPIRDPTNRPKNVKNVKIMSPNAVIDKNYKPNMMEELSILLLMSSPQSKLISVTRVSFI